MKKTLFSLLIALMAVVGAQAQQIAVVTSNGSTTMYQNLTDAINGATSGSTIYLPGGAFSVGEMIAITKKITIIGIGHKANGENADGNTTISGNLAFNNGSSGSAVMGCYLAGHVSIGYDGKPVHNILVRYCNVQGVHIECAQSTGTINNQNYIRGTCWYHGASVQITNNVMYTFQGVNGGVISNNITLGNGKVTTNDDTGSSTTSTYAIGAKNSTITGNVCINWGNGQTPLYGDNCLVSGNMYSDIASPYFGDDYINVYSSTWVGWDSIFENYNSGAISPASNFHFKGSYAKYESQCGIYAGTGFSDSALPPVPYIVSKQIPEQTDANGYLNIKMRVKASE